MANQAGEPSPGEFIGPRVRQNALGAGIAAALMLYFSFSGGGYVVPEGDGAFAIGGTIFIYTLKLGGFAMLASALLSLTGSVIALLFDAVCSVVTGLGLCASAGLMMAGGGSGLLYILFGVLFVGAGIRNGRDWNQLAMGDGRRHAPGYRPGDGVDDV